ncbi:MAG: hypothetical protein AAFQ80_19480 [Cyanobacteria bacterium J06621_8]
MSKLKLKPCDRCGNLAGIRYRIQYQADQSWVMVCRDCWNLVSSDNPYYRYGGTWKAKKK